jgi:hypothetical protein
LLKVRSGSGFLRGRIMTLSKQTISANNDTKYQRPRPCKNPDGPRRTQENESTSTRYPFLGTQKYYFDAAPAPAKDMTFRHRTTALMVRKFIGI